MTDRSFHILSSPGFVSGLFLLLLNDFVLKEQFHNGLTGKLSDFAGLFVFPLFWSAFFPRRKALIYVSSAVLFGFWKSGHSQFLIEGWNSLPFFGIQRTVDYSDLWALLILPLSYLYSDVASGVHVPRRLGYLIALVSIVAFTATQFSHKVAYNNQYQLQISKKELLKRMSRMPEYDVHESFWESDSFKVSFDDCNGRANFTLQERDKQSVITLTEMEYGCPTRPEDDEMRQYFEKEFINKLRDGPVGRSLEVISIWSSPIPSSSNTPSP